MGREVKRVPVDFDWPLKKTWHGYLMPAALRLPDCPYCDGRGYSARARELFDLWYGYVPFKPEDNDSIPLSVSTPAVRAYAERNVSHSPGFYGSGEFAIVREAARLAALWNGQWSHHVNADDVTALLDADRLWDFTRTWTKEAGWQVADPPVTPTPEQVNEWSIRTMGHDAINASAVVRARCEREGAPELCDRCNGQGDIATAEQRAAHEAWKSSEPPAGDGWQLWETVSEGSPISPVFAQATDLADWMTRNDCTVHGAVKDFDVALKFVLDGWAPSFVATPDVGLIDGVSWVGQPDSEVK